MAKKPAAKGESSVKGEDTRGGMNKSGSPAPRSSSSTERKSNGGGVEGVAVAEGQISVPAGEAVQPVEVAIPEMPGVSAEQSKPRREVTHQRIAERAYEIYMRGEPGSPEDHWLLAERELRGE